MQDARQGKRQGNPSLGQQKQETRGKWQELHHMASVRHMASGKARQGEDKGTDSTVISSFMSLLGIPSENRLSKFFSKILN